jgi:hypothetical protein
VAELSLVVASKVAPPVRAALVSKAPAFPDVGTVAASAQEGVQKSQRTRTVRQRIDALNSL